MENVETNKHAVTLKEYGKNIQRLANHIVGIEDRDKRTQSAFALVELVKQLNPHMKTENDQKIWDDIHIMSGFALDVDGPYPKPEEDLLFKKPQRVGYPKGEIKFKHYGRNIEKLIEKAVEIEDDEDLHEILEQRISLDYEDIWDEIAFSLSIAYTDAQGSADYNEAFEQLTDHIAYQLGMDLDKGIKWDGNYMVVPLERGHEPSGDKSDVKYELSQVMDIDYLQADYEEPEYETYHQPRYGFQGTIDEEHLNELIRERLYL